MNAHLKALIDSVADCQAAMTAADVFIQNQHERDTADEVLQVLLHHVEINRTALRFRMRESSQYADLDAVRRAARLHDIPA